MKIFQQLWRAAQWNLILCNESSIILVWMALQLLKKSKLGKWNNN